MIALITRRKVRTLFTKSTAESALVFELGLNKFSRVKNFLLSYIAFLRHVNDFNNMRALYEQLMQNFQGDESDDIWREYHAFEVVYGSLAAVTALENRRVRSNIPENTTSSSESVSALVERYRFGNLWPCSSAELSSFVGDEHVSQQPKRPKMDDRRRSVVIGGVVITY